MNILVDKSGTVEGFTSLLKKAMADDLINGLIILTCDKNGFTPETLDAELKSIPVPLFGGIFPAILHGREKLERGTIIICLKQKTRVAIVPDLSDGTKDHETVLEDLALETGSPQTVFIFVDGYAQKISALLESVFNIFGTGPNYIGGGAGSINPEALDMNKRPCILTNQGIITDSAVIGLVDMESGIGVNHGWHKISGPFKITESVGNAIQSLDWRPAFDVYKEIIRQYSKEVITKENFFDIAKRFPFGMSRLDSEIIVRDPFTVEGDSLIVATEIPPESFVDILSGDIDSLVDAAGKSSISAMNAYQGSRDKTIFLVDCISRVLFLEDDFEKEIRAVSQEDTPLIGILSLGEIANSGRDFMELYNKTCVVGILGE